MKQTCDIGGGLSSSSSSYKLYIEAPLNFLMKRTMIA